MAPIMRRKWRPYSDGGEKARLAKLAIAELLDDLLESVTRKTDRSRPYLHRRAKCTQVSGSHSVYKESDNSEVDELEH